MKWDGEIYIDSQAESYKALDMPRWSKWWTIKRFFNFASMRFAKTIQYNPSNLKGDGFQSGGVLVCTAGADKPAYIWKEKDHAMDQFADLTAIRQHLGIEVPVEAPATTAEPQKAKQEESC
eukprot:TRINITY_DN67399_c6_g1_i10.p1 TRINITY_DN67399_c6_g1~~TRINITY_DN67399_c6_g1_i10.p1  ORF type:complete len:121 (-),score=13.23 TRINITY_DN67399_c6_g1_i10:359-721(-)